MSQAGPDDAGDPTFAHSSIEESYAKLGSRAQGLTSAQAAERLREHGPNIIPQRRKRFGASLVVQVKNLFNVLLVVAALLCFISGVSASDQSSIQMGVVILVVVAVSILFSLFQEHRAEKAVEAIRSLIPATARVLREGKVSLVQAGEVVVGDLIILEAGDKVPADARVVDCYDLSVDNSALTGESEPSPRSSFEMEEGGQEKVISCPNLVFAGTTVSSGTGTALVTATGAGTEFGRVVRLAQEIEEVPSPLQRELDRTARLNFMV
ncbi:MAG: cation-transporting P-type ATPase, partial [Methanomassiliicoccales archaeon]|nr:cation-transporting P-type ATPase [Methanomassiliicoccales archaeon]